ncbi:MAG: hypothetical protein HYR74_10830 [Candidatus Eisenbacteria bacterium]|nr:hypothetical protein [Candidatus Eisenbacteria bacterium]
MRFPPFRHVARLTLTLLIVAVPAAAGVIRGELWLSHKAADHAHAADAATVSTRRPAPSPPPRSQRGVADGVIYVETVPEKVEKKLAPKPNARKKPPLPRIVQLNQRYEPRVLATPIGCAVELENLDRVYHNTFSVSVAKRFDLRKYPPGHRDTLTFERCGVVNLHCDIHPDEIGYVVVVPNHVFTRPDSTGRFALPKLPPGAYTLRVWHPRLGELTRAVTVPKHGDTQIVLAY